MRKLNEVELVSLGVYLPGEPVPFDKIEDAIGKLDQAPPKIQRMVHLLRRQVKDLIGIDQCHFAIDHKTKEITETNATMTVKAIKTALDKANLKSKDLDCILLANPLPDCMTPPTTTIIQEMLGIERCAEIEVHSNCTGTTKVFQIAFDAVRLGRYKKVAVCYSQLSSAYLRSTYLNQQKLEAEDLLLRWFLSDSASAIIIQPSDKIKSGIKIIDVYNESVGGKLKPAMWTSIGGAEFDLPKLHAEGKHHLSQDYHAVNTLGPGILAEAFKTMIGRAGVNKEAIHHVLATIPSTMLISKGKEILLKELSIPEEKWFSNLQKKGYSGGSSVLIGLDEMIDRKIFKPGETLAGVTIESSKWMVGGFILKYL